MTHIYKTQHRIWLTALLCTLINPITLSANDSCPPSTIVALPLDLDAHIAECRQYLQELSQNHAETLDQFDALAFEWKKYAKHAHGVFDVHQLLKAVKFASTKHAGQLRDGGAPYMVHPLSVAGLLWKTGGIRSSNVIISALLHDTVEDTKTSFEEIEAQFGTRVRMTIAELTDDPALSYQQQMQNHIDHAPQMSLNAQLVKLADRLHNLSCLLDNPPSNWTQAEIADYFAWSQQLLAAFQGVNKHLEKRLAKVIKAFERNQEHSSCTPCTTMQSL